MNHPKNQWDLFTSNESYSELETDFNVQTKVQWIIALYNHICKNSRSKFFVSVAPIVVLCYKGCGRNGCYGRPNQGVADPDVLAPGESGDEEEEEEDDEEDPGQKTQ